VTEDPFHGQETAFHGFFMFKNDDKLILLGVQPRGRPITYKAFHELPFMHGVYRSSDNKDVLVKMHMNMDNGFDALNELLSTASRLYHLNHSSEPCLDIHHALLWMHAGQLSTRILLLLKPMGTLLVTLTDTGVIESMSPINGGHLYHQAEDIFNVVFHHLGDSSKAVQHHLKFIRDATGEDVMQCMYLVGGSKGGTQYQNLHLRDELSTIEQFSVFAIRWYNR